MRYWLDAGGVAEPTAADGVEIDASLRRGERLRAFEQRLLAFAGAERGAAATTRATRSSTCSRARARRPSAGSSTSSAGGAPSSWRAGRPGASRRRPGCALLSVLVNEPLPAAPATPCSLPASGPARPRGAVHAPRDAGARLRVGDPVRRLHPAGPRARPLPPLRRGRLRARGRGHAPHRGRERAAARPAPASTCRRGSSTASRTPAPTRCRCSASSGPAGSPAEAYYPDGAPAAVAEGRR